MRGGSIPAASSCSSVGSISSSSACARSERGALTMGGTYVPWGYWLLIGVPRPSLVVAALVEHATIDCSSIGIDGTQQAEYFVLVIWAAELCLRLGSREGLIIGESPLQGFDHLFAVHRFLAFLTFHLMYLLYTK